MIYKKRGIVVTIILLTLNVVYAVSYSLKEKTNDIEFYIVSFFMPFVSAIIINFFYNERNFFWKSIISTELFFFILYFLILVVLNNLDITSLGYEFFSIFFTIIFLSILFILIRFTRKNG